MDAKASRSKPPGFWDRLSRFVRHPTIDWAETEIGPAAGKEKGCQREEQLMTRATALIRNREFEVLRREMRNRKTQSPEALEGLSLPSTLPPPINAVSRRHTLSKINAIERQIQAEDRKRNDLALPNGPIRQSGAARVDFAASAPPPVHPRRASTPRWNHGNPVPRPSRLPGTSPPDHRSSLPQRQGGNPMPPTPAALELAAFDFAEGHDTQAELQLQFGLQIETDSVAAQRIFQALLDLYWATGQQDRLLSRSLDFVQRFGQTPAPRPDLGTIQSGRHQTASFAATEQFDILQLRAFERFVDDSTAHLVLDFSALIGISAQQREPLAAALARLNGRDVELELHGVDMLLAASRLRSSPAEPADAALRLQVLRLVGDESGFVDLAVQLAVECSCSPVDWTPPRFKRLNAVEDAGATALRSQQARPAHSRHSRVGSRLSLADIGQQHTTARLGGDLLGGGEVLLRGLRAQAALADTITVELHAVRRMDFSAATDLLNWVDAQTQLGKTVELCGAHALLAPFLQSVGLNALA